MNRASHPVQKPTCPKHPEATILAADLTGEDHGAWVCVVCGDVLGDCPKPETITDRQDI
ncbi:hypothetical protein LCGC14_2377830 [marine sediment metagenome]|uniref:Uncharacterized protein n=1 Tax=marine sediment metagenome TaxID=412755 RepID=A0A0F9EE70_9ZZZZ